ncbi:MAG: serine/threonine protein kinase, partial [Deltaproteobacteria bacterium]|nr:serine/threonine protein kinase [Deltaproteobacteria bacterium]
MDATDPRWKRRTAAADATPTVPEAPEEAAPVAAVAVEDDRFAIGPELGRGGMGRVVEAYDRALGRAVAIKQSLTADRGALARFEREARITARLQHPGIVPILDVGRDERGNPYYIMRKIDGEPLQARVAAAAGVRERLALVAPLLGAIDAVAYAHDRRVLHRDIKPANILLGPFGETLLIDWGLARELEDRADRADQAERAGLENRAERAERGDAPSDAGGLQEEGLTRLGAAYGTPGFLAPEQARGEAVDARADVYSLGATLYFVLAGEVPFHAAGATAAVELAAAGTAPDLGAIPREVPAELAAIAAKALSPDAAARYADAGELASDLRRFLAGQLVSAHAYTAGERVRRWIGRHRAVATVAAVAFAAVVATVLVAFRRVSADRDRALAASILAEQRADELLVDRARSLITVDPTSAVAALRGLRAGSPLWDTGRAIVRAAVSGGVERLVGR